MVNKIFIYTCGGGGREIVRLIRDINNFNNKWKVVGFIDDDPDKQGQEIDNIRVYSSKKLLKTNDLFCICGLMNPALKKKVIEEKIIPNGYKIPSLIHPSITIPDDSSIGSGTIIYSGAHISYNVKIGENVLISFNSLVGHDSSIGDYVSIMPTTTINGNCKIGSGCVLGAGSVLHQGVSIGNNSVIGIGTKVLTSIEPNKTVMDMPRKVMLDK